MGVVHSKNNVDLNITLQSSPNNVIILHDISVTIYKDILKSLYSNTSYHYQFKVKKHKHSQLIQQRWSIEYLKKQINLQLRQHFPYYQLYNFNWTIKESIFISWKMIDDIFRKLTYKLEYAICKNHLNCGYICEFHSGQLVYGFEKKLQFFLTNLMKQHNIQTNPACLSILKRDDYIICNFSLIESL